MNTILIKKNKATVYDYTDPKRVTWKDMSLELAGLNLIQYTRQGNVIVYGDTPHPLGSEIHVVPKDEYNRTITQKGRIR